jgi:hypothetical protein
VGIHQSKKGFRDQVEDAVNALEASLSRKIGVYLIHKKNVHLIFLTLLTDAVQHMLRLHRMMDGQFLHYRTILGAACGEGYWILSSQFVEAVFAGSWLARFSGVDAFSETGHTRVRCIYGLPCKPIE